MKMVGSKEDKKFDINIPGYAYFNAIIIMFKFQINKLLGWRWGGDQFKSL